MLKTLFKSVGALLLGILTTALLIAGFYASTIILVVTGLTMVSYALFVFFRYTGAHANDR